LPLLGRVTSHPNWQIPQFNYISNHTVIINKPEENSIPYQYGPSLFHPQPQYNKIQNNPIIHHNSSFANLTKPDNPVFYPISTLSSPFPNLLMQHQEKITPQKGINTENTNTLNFISHNISINDKIFEKVQEGSTHSS
jgi:hypothetical protein